MNSIVVRTVSNEFITVRPYGYGRAVWVFNRDGIVKNIRGIISKKGVFNPVEETDKDIALNYVRKNRISPERLFTMYGNSYSYSF